MKKCTCGNPQFGFDCVCDFVKKNPGSNEYSCEHCGTYKASKPRCNMCEQLSCFSSSEVRNAKGEMIGW
jgi:hypothetical protein